MNEINGPAAGSTPEAGSMPEWEMRFRAPRVGLPEWAEDAPDRSLFVSNVTGTYELYAWDRATGGRRQVTDRPNGTTDGSLSRDGAWVWWFSDTDGDEFGVWMRQPFAGGEDVPAAPGLAPSYPAGLALGVGGLAVIGRSTDDEGTSVHVVRPDGGSLEIYRHPESAGVGDLSEDGTLVVIEHTEHGDAMHSALRVLRVEDGSTVAELDDTDGGRRELGLDCLGFAPLPGDTRLLVGHQRADRWLPMVWDVASGTETALAIDLPGDVHAEWYPDGSALLVVHDFHARSEMFRYDLADGSMTALEAPAGSVSGATARPDGTVEYLWSSAARPPAVRSTDGSTVLEAPGLRAPDSVPVEDVWVDGPEAASTRWCSGRRPERRARRGPSRRSSRSTAARPGTTPTPSRPARPRGSTTASPSSGSTTAVRPGTAGSGPTPSSTGWA